MSRDGARLARTQIEPANTGPNGRTGALDPRAVAEAERLGREAYLAATAEHDRDPQGWRDRLDLVRERYAERLDLDLDLDQTTTQRERKP